jgi:hypothetical protein
MGSGLRQSRSSRVCAFHVAAAAAAGSARTAAARRIAIRFPRLRRRAAENRLAELEAEVEAYRDRAERAERWLPV